MSSINSPKTASLNTYIIALDRESNNTFINNPRCFYTMRARGRRVYKSSAKTGVLNLRGRRVSNVALFNSPTVRHVSTPTLGITTMVEVGLKYRGAERRYWVPTVWKIDPRGNYRRHISRAQFLSLPQELQDVAIRNGVSTKGDIIFSRCVAAWAGHNVKGMHVHHVNMDTTDDRLGNLWVLTVAEHSAVHGDKDGLVWDEDWCEYSNAHGGTIQVYMDLYITDEDMAVEIDPTTPYPRLGTYLTSLLELNEELLHSLHSTQAIDTSQVQT